MTVSFSAHQENHFQKQIVQICPKQTLSNTDVRFRFCKVKLRNTLFICSRKKKPFVLFCLFCFVCFVLFVLFCLFCFVCFVLFVLLQYSDFDLFFNESSHQGEKDAVKETIIRWTTLKFLNP